MIRVKAFPVIKCYSSGGQYALDAVIKSRKDAGLPFEYDKYNAAANSGKFWLYSYLDPELVKMNAEFTYAAAAECRMREEYHLGTNWVRGRMVYQDFMGTVDLAHDLDALRAAVGSEHLSIWGVSYGTEVGATYGSIFPERVDRLILDGNVAVSNEVYRAAELWALSYEQVWNGFTAACDADYFMDEKPKYEQCAAAPHPSQKIMRKIAELEASKPSDAEFNTILANLYGIVQAAFDAGRPSLPRMQKIGVMHHGVYPAGAILMACVEGVFRNESIDVPGCCYREGDVAKDGRRKLDGEEEPSYANPVVNVRSVDMQGRLNPDDLTRLWSALKQKHPLGFLRASNILSIAVAPNVPRPTPPYGSSLDAMRPLIIGNFNDPATTYDASQAMHTNFPNGALLSWQGYQHGLPMTSMAELAQVLDQGFLPFTWGGVGAVECVQKLMNYIKTKELPHNGDTCPINGPAAGTMSMKTAVGAIGEGYCLGS